MLNELGTAHPWSPIKGSHYLESKGPTTLLSALRSRAENGTQCRFEPLCVIVVAGQLCKLLREPGLGLILDSAHAGQIRDDGFATRSVRCPVCTKKDGTWDFQTVCVAVFQGHVRIASRGIEHSITRRLNPSFDDLKQGFSVLVVVAAHDCEVERVLLGELFPAARNTLDSARIPRASKLLICGLFQKGRVLAQDGVE